MTESKPPQAPVAGTRPASAPRSGSPQSTMLGGPPRTSCPTAPCRARACAFVYCANAPSHSEPKTGRANERLSSWLRTMVRTMTRSPMRTGSTPAPAARMAPQQSASRMRGKTSGAPVRATTASSTSSWPSSAALVAPRPFREPAGSGVDVRAVHACRQDDGQRLSAGRLSERRRDKQASRTRYGRSTGRPSSRNGHGDAGRREPAKAAGTEQRPHGREARRQPGRRAVAVRAGPGPRRQAMRIPSVRDALPRRDLERTRRRAACAACRVGEAEPCRPRARGGRQGAGQPRRSLPQASRSGRDLARTVRARSRRCGLAHARIPGTSAATRGTRSEAAPGKRLGVAVSRRGPVAVPQPAVARVARA